jgi:hypothetical protein
MVLKYNVLINNFKLLLIIFSVIFSSSIYACVNNEADFINTYSKYLVAVEVYGIKKINDSTEKIYERLVRTTGILASEDGAIISDYKALIKFRDPDKYKVIVYNSPKLLRYPTKDTYDFKSFDELVNKYEGVVDGKDIYTALISSVSDYSELLLLSLNPDSIKSIKGLKSVHDMPFLLSRAVRGRSGSKGKLYCTLGFQEDFDNKEIFIKFNSASNISRYDDKSRFKLNGLSNDSHNNFTAGGIVISDGRLVGVLSSKTDYVTPIVNYYSFFPKLFLSNLRKNVDSVKNKADDTDQKFQKFVREYYTIKNILWDVDYTRSSGCDVKFIATKDIKFPPPYIKLINVRLEVSGLNIENPSRPYPEKTITSFYLENRNESNTDIQAGDFCLPVIYINGYLKSNEVYEYSSLRFIISPVIIWENDKLRVLESDLKNKIDDYNLRAMNREKNKPNIVKEINKRWSIERQVRSKNISFPVLRVENNNFTSQEIDSDRDRLEKQISQLIKKELVKREIKGGIK